ncbi:TPA: FRG domain-containing protein [Vibrio diabolicus]
MNYIETKLFGTVAQPSNLIELLSLVSNHAGERRNVYLWRGQANINWPIHSSAFRRLVSRGNVRELDMQSYEKYLLGHATHQGYRFENGRELSDFELLAKLQHHGAATRLVDVSRNILVGLWFCCSSEPNEMGLLLGVHSDNLGGGENKGENRPYSEIFEDLEEYEYPQTWQPPTVTKRIAAQGGQFLYSAVSQYPTGSLTLDDSPDANLYVAISPDAKKEFLAQLEGTFDIRYLTLFPDIDGFGYAHSFRYDRFETERW